MISESAFSLVGDRRPMIPLLLSDDELLTREMFITPNVDIAYKDI
jgi:hypothetical protein